MPLQRVTDRMPNVFQLKISLAHVKPAVWRRIVVAASDTLADLHMVIQDAMGWYDSHLHMFFIDGAEYGVRDEHGDFDVLDENRYKLSRVLSEGQKFRYVYDFGDDWVHEIKVEKVRAAGKDEVLPACLAGKNACPPEDCGGPYGYPELIAALSNPEHESHDELSEWAGEFDPMAFDLDLINQRLQGR